MYVNELHTCALCIKVELYYFHVYLRLDKKAPKLSRHLQIYNDTNPCPPPHTHTQKSSNWQLAENEITPTK